MTARVLPFPQRSAMKSHTFASVAEARQALALDKLGTVYRAADKVIVLTAHGRGEFSPAEWAEPVGGINAGR